MNRRFLLQGSVLLAATSVIAGCAQTEGADIVDLALRFRTAALAEDAPQMRALTREAEVLAET
ncbi:MAG: hypothetical protein AAFO98_14580, partial [Pseudomonadota bacterium]